MMSQHHCHAQRASGHGAPGGRHTNALGQIDRLWVIFKQYCECNTNWMDGDIRYNSQLASLYQSPVFTTVPSNQLAVIHGRGRFMARCRPD